MKYLKYLYVALLAAVITSCSSTKPVTDPDVDDESALQATTALYAQGLKEAGKREFRGAWIQTAFQDRYSAKTTAQCKAYLERLVENLYQTGFNAIIFQVRPEGDAFYRSNVEPWSRFLTGRQGKAPSPAWDPMEYLIQLCHERQMEFHAWINPYRMFASKNNLKLDAGHIYYQHSEWFVMYDGRLYLNPGLPESRSWIRQVVKDIVSRYDIDALHMDDYFYPYPTSGLSFDDSWAFANYGPVMGFDTSKKEDLANFRRRSVNILIRSLSEDIKALKPWVRFGISPFGIYRNKKSSDDGSDTNGTQCYDDLYADVLLWAESGWIDYLMPQLYWEIGHKAADYETLCHWWAKHTPAKCHLYIGQSIERSLDGKAGEASTPKLTQSSREFVRKLNMTRKEKRIDGNCFWYAYQVEDNQYGVRDFLRQGVFATRALPEAYTELSSTLPDQVRSLDGRLVKVAEAQGGVALHLTWQEPKESADGKNRARYYNVYRFAKGERLRTSVTRHLYAQVNTPEFYDMDVTTSKKYTYVVTAVDYYNNEGKEAKESFRIKL